MTSVSAHAYEPTIVSSRRTCFDKVSSVKDPNCPVCNVHLKTIAKVLPYAHCSVSKLICAQSREPINESNPPLMLPNGYVYGSKVVTRPHVLRSDRVRSSRHCKPWLPPTTAKWSVHGPRKPTIYLRQRRCTLCSETTSEQCQLGFDLIFYLSINICTYIYIHRRAHPVSSTFFR